MNRVYYRHILGLIIDDLIDKKEKIVDDIIETTSMFEYHSENDIVDLTKEEIDYINECRQKMFVYHLLISDLEKLRKEEK